MQTITTRALRRNAFGAFAATLLAGSALAGPSYLTPNTTTGLGPTT
jgi:hypothetical protein